MRAAGLKGSSALARGVLKVSSRVERQPKRSTYYWGRGEEQFVTPKRYGATPTATSLEIFRARQEAKAMAKAYDKNLPQRLPKPIYERTGASGFALTPERQMGSLVNYPTQQRPTATYKELTRQEVAAERKMLGGYTRAELEQIQTQKKEQKLMGPLLNQYYEKQARRAEEEPKYVKEQEALARQQAQERYIQKTGRAVERIKEGTKATKKALTEFGETSRGVDKAAGKAFKSAAGAYKYRYKMSKSLLAFSNAFGGTSRGGQSTPGRPKMVYVHRSPFSGKPIPASMWYKEMRLFRKLQQDKAEGVQRQTVRQLAQRGVPPQQMQQMQQQVPVRQLPMVRPQMTMPQFQQPVRQPLPPMVTPQQLQQQAQQLPNGTIIPRGNSVWKFRRGIVGTEGGLMGRQQKVYGLPESFWN